MNGISKRRIGLGALTGLVIASAIGFNTMNVSGAEPIEATDPYLVPYGTLTVDITSRAGVVTFDPAGAGATVTQEILTVQPCNKIAFGAITPSPTPPAGDLMSFTPIVGGTTGPLDTVQIPSDGIGVHTGSNCGGPAGLLGPNEEMVIGIGGYFASNVSAASASLAIGKTHPQDGKLNVELDTEVLATQDVSVGGQTLTVQRATGTFDTVTLSSTANQNSRGLSVKSGTTLNLVVPGTFEVAVDCGEKVTDIGGTGEIALDALFYRGENLTKQSTACSDVGVTVEIIPDNATTPGVNEASVFWDNGSTGVNGLPQAVSGTVTINWTGVTDQTKLNRTIDYDAGGSAFDWQPVVWCTSFATSDGDSDGILTFTATRPQVTQTNGAGTEDDVQVEAPWCLVSNSVVLVGNQYIQSQVYYGQGDPQAR
jgi:hypothetical protein